MWNRQTQKGELGYTKEKGKKRIGRKDLTIKERKEMIEKMF